MPQISDEIKGIMYKFVNELWEECEKKGYGLFVKFIDDHKAEMEREMEQVFKSEQEFSDYMDEKEKISLENAASNLSMTVPEFEELLKKQKKSA